MIQTIKLNKLKLSPFNVRQVADAESTADLEASIAAHGLLSPLVAHPMPRKFFGVLAGGRRLHALKAMAARGEITEDLDVSVEVREDYDADATELSIVENTARVALPPVIEFEAFARLADEGDDVAEIAKRFATTEIHVRQRMRLGRLHPGIRAALGANRISLDAARAYAAYSDQDLQKRVFDEVDLRRSHYPQIIRSAYQQQLNAGGNVAAMLRLVGLDAYAAAGGRSEPDLFEPNQPEMVLDVELLRQLHRDKMDAERERLAAVLPAGAVLQLHSEGLGTRVRVEAELLPHQIRRRQEIDERTEEIAERLDVIAEVNDDGPSTRFVALNGADTDEVKRLAAELTRLETESEAIAEAGARTPEGPIIAVARVDDGRLSITGYYRPAGFREADEGSGQAAGESTHHPPVANGLIPESQRTPGAPSPDAPLKTEFGLSKDAIEVMRSHRRKILQAALMANAQGRQLAQDLLAFATLRSMLGSTSASELGVHRAAAREYDPPIGADERDQQPAARLVAQIEAKLRAAAWMTERDPAKAFLIFAEDVTPSDYEEAIAFAGVLMLNRSLNAPGYAVGVHDVIAHLAHIDDEAIRGLWTPDEAFFRRLPKSRRMDALRELGPKFAQSATSLADADLAERAADAFRAEPEDVRRLGMLPDTAVRARAWVPEYLRFQAPEIPDAPPPDAAADNEPSEREVA